MKTVFVNPERCIGCRQCEAATGLETDWGVVVDDCPGASAPGVWAAGDVAETRDRLTGDRYVHAIWPNADAHGRVVAERMLGFDTRYPGAERMNSLRHLGLPLVAAGRMDGTQELRVAGEGTLRKLVLEDNRIVGFRLTGDIRGAGAYRALMLAGRDVGPCRPDLLDPGFRLAGLAA